MIYLLDTCTVSDFIRGDKNTIDRLVTKPPYQVKLSSVTAYELQYGLHKNPNLKTSTRNAVLGILNDVEIISFDSHIAETAAKIRSALELRGKLIGAYDILIAATALHHNYTMVTSNEKEFSRIEELRWENWKV